MNRFITYLLLLPACAALTLAGCTADQELDRLPEASVGEGSSWTTIDFNDNTFDEICITSRATLDPAAEKRVSNLFVFLFGPKNENGDAQRVYGRYFDHTNRKDFEHQLLDSKEECWWVAGNASDTEQPHGKVRIIAPEISGGTLYMIANVNADMVNISPDKLRYVQTLSDLENMTATLNQEITERNGFFPMTGLVEGVAISNGRITAAGNGDKNKFPVLLTRLDAKIEVKVRVAKGYHDSRSSSVSGGQAGSGGTGDTGAITTHTIDSFVPLSWRVVNMPRTTFVLPRSEDASTVMFATRERKFETRRTVPISYLQKEKNETTGIIEEVVKNVETDEHGFSFYMLENRAAPKEFIPDEQVKNEGKGYNARETRLKDADGTYEQPKEEEKSDIWKYAPAEGTYLVLKGEVVMALKIDNEGKDQQLSADVEYYIHLGDFGVDIDNYDVLRNTAYTYTITIYGVDNIQIEVEEKTTENQSGATGHVYVAKESIFTFDSHFDSEVVSFDEAHINITDERGLTWYVKTPFGREGTPHIVGGIEVPAGLDYQWVHFIVNERDSEGKYLKGHANYDPEKAMNILEFSKYIKEQKAKFVEDREKDGVIDNESDFRPELDDDWKKKFPDNESVWTRYRIHVTIFVDEFYYTSNPITGDVRPDLWKDFVNQPNRLMHILCDSDDSADEASRMTGSVVTIRQRSIQTVYNFEKPELQTAWGCESIDETRDVLWYFSRKEKYDSSGNWVAPPSGIPDESLGNDSGDNGLYNTAKIWGLTPGDSDYAPKQWSDYVDFDQSYALCDADEKKTLRYSCLTRNRDENGNGIIDANEIKWYMASINQLAALYIGDQGLHADAILYPYYKQKITSSTMDLTDNRNIYPWRVHIVSSTSSGSGGYYHRCPEILWAEEGMSTGPYDKVWSKSAGLSVRCVRNLGMDVSSEEEARKNLRDKNYTPEPVIQVSGPGVSGNNESVSPNSVYKFDLTNLNPMSIRYYSSQELEPNNEFSIEARTYWAFETGILTDEKYTYPELENLIKEGKSPCPDGYRVPNVREGSLMALFCPDWNWMKALNDKGEMETISGRVSTWYSHGLLGTDQDLGTENIDIYPNNDWARSNSWIFNDAQMYLDKKYDSCPIRCVRDIRQ